MADATVDKRTRPEPPLIVFVHVPKTAGTTLGTVLSMNEPGARSRAFGNVFKGGGGLDKGPSERLRDGNGPDLEPARIVMGHFPLGIREYLPRYLSAGRELRCFTFLREPADRTLSHYFQIRETRRGSRGPRKYAAAELPPEPTLDDMLAGGYIHDNLHTRMLSGLPEPFGEVTDEMLEQAKQNLREELVFFGLTERFDESLVLAKQRLGFSTILYKSNPSVRSLRKSSGRVNTTRPRGDEVPKELAQAAERCNRYDIELYRYAQELFDGAPERQELEFEIELAALRAAKAEGEIEAKEPAPEGFGGAEEEWRMLLHARATLLRRDLDLAEVRALADGFGQREREVLEELGGISKRGKSRPGRDPDTALRVIEMLAPAQAEALRRAKPEPKAPGPKKARSAGPKQKARSAGPKQTARSAGPKQKARSAGPKARGRQPSAPVAGVGAKPGTRRRVTTLASSGDPSDGGGSGKRVQPPEPAPNSGSEAE